MGRPDSRLQRRTLRSAAALTACALAIVAAGATARADTGPAIPTPAVPAVAPVPPPPPPPPVVAPPGPFVSLLFSRTEISEADGCVPNDTNIARLDTEVAPYLKSLGLTATGTLATDRVLDTEQKCTHNDASLMASWADAKNLADNFGWTFVSHTATYPVDLTTLTPAQEDAETCGSANTIDAHGLPGAHGLIAYPGTGGAASEIQADYGSKCFAWGRQYGASGLTLSSAATTAPYWQRTQAGNGGACNDPTAACYTVVSSNDKRYSMPGDLVAQLDALTPGQWFSLQSFILVKGKSPTYTNSDVAWDCTSTDPALHWTNDNERWCWGDFQTVMKALVAKGIQVTDPLTVGVAFGRPATYPTTATSPSTDTTPPSEPGSFTASPNPHDASISLAWTASTDDVGVVGYRLERSTDDATWTTLSPAITTTSYVDDQTSYAAHYFYRLTALDAAGNGSDPATTEVVTAPPPPIL